jgi:DNA-binding MarR family transcriptional regulator
MSKTRWLDQNEQRTWRIFMLATKLLWDQLEREVDQATEVPSAYYEVLVRLSEAPDRRLRLSDLADQSQSSRSRLSHSVARLEGLGWIHREGCQTDRRGAYAVLTGAGLRALEAAAPVHVEGVRKHLFDVLSTEQMEELGAISERILEHLIEVRGASPSVEGLLGTLGTCQSAALGSSQGAPRRPRR